MDSILSHDQLENFLKEICAGDTAIFLELLGDCEADLREQWSVLEGSLQEKDWKRFNRAAHTIKSTARTFGSTPLYEKSKMVEKLSENDPPASIKALIEEKEAMGELMRRFCIELEKIRSAPDAFFNE